MSFGRQLPPKPQPASRNAGDRRLAALAGLAHDVEVGRFVHAAHHVRDVDVTDSRAQSPDLVRERDQRSEHGIRRVLDHLRGLGVREHARHGGKAFVHCCNRASRALVDAADHDAIGLHEVATAVPSVRNSGFMPRPKSGPARLPEVFSTASRTMPSVVPGITVLLTTTVW